MLSKVDSTPPFLAASNLKYLIDKEITESTAAVEFISTKGVLVRGYTAELLPQVCRVYLAARDQGIILASQRHIHATMGLMRVADSWDQLKSMMDKAFPKNGDTMPLLFD